MKRVTNRVQKKQGSPNRDAIGFLLRALNSEWHQQDNTSRRYKTLLVPHAGQLARIVLRLQRLVIDTPKTFSVWADYSTPADRHVSQLNQQLGTYRTTPHIHTDGHGGWQFMWSIESTGSEDGGLAMSDLRPSSELPLILTAIRLAEQGLIDRIRRCPVDRRWFHARAEGSRFCNSKCRNLFHQRDAKDKERRRTWAKANYQSRKELETGSRIVARKKGKK